jgi:hypothetical protein
MDVPESFPRDPWPAALSGAQPKLALRLEDGQYKSGISDEEREARYAMCADLVEQLVAYCRRKQAQQPEKPLETLLEQVDAAVRTRGWDTSPIELTWCMARVREQLS